jgi:glutathione S-transferase
MNAPTPAMPSGTERVVVHHLEKSRSHRVLWLLEELQVPYRLQVHARDPASRLAPASLRAVHPLGKAPVIELDGEVVAESAHILETLAETFEAQAQGLALVPPARTPAHRRYRFWLHYAEGSLMNWLVMQLVFASLPKQPMPFFVRPVARGLCQAVQQRLIQPNLDTARDYLESQLGPQPWLAGDTFTLADVQMGFAVAALAASAPTGPGQPSHPRLQAYLQRLQARPAYQRALARGGPLF